MRETVIIVTALALIFGVSAALVFLGEALLWAHVPSAFDPVKKIDLLVFGLFLWMVVRATDDIFQRRNKEVDRRLTHLMKRLENLEEKVRG